LIPTIADSGIEISKVLRSWEFCETGSRRKPWGNHHWRLHCDLPRCGQSRVVDRGAPEVLRVWKGMLHTGKPKPRAHKKTNQQ